METVSTGVNILKSALREVLQRIKQEFRLNTNTPKIMISSGESFFHSLDRISEGISVAIAQLNKDWRNLKAKGIDMGDLRYGLKELRNLKSYFDYVRKKKKLPLPGWFGKGKSAYNDKPMIPYVAAVIQKIPVSL